MKTHVHPASDHRKGPDGLRGLLLAISTGAQTIGNHPAVYDRRGNLKPWTSWRDAINREVNWYLKCPVTNGYPHFVAMTFMRDDYQPRLDRPDFIPATQNGMGIISYLKYHAWTGRKNPKLIAIARAMGDYLVKEDLTPDEANIPASRARPAFASNFRSRRIAARRRTNPTKSSQTRAASPPTRWCCFTKRRRTNAT